MTAIAPPGIAAAIPASHLDLVQGPPVAALTTLMPDGSPQTSVVWCDYDGECVRVNCMRGFQKERNMRRDPRVALLCFDPRRPLRYLEIEGRVVSMAEEGALEHLDALARCYAGRPIRYFGECIPASFEATETPILCRILPIHVASLDWQATGDGRPPESGTMTAPTAAPLPTAAPTEVPLPASHLDLLERPICGVLTTLGPTGRPRSSLVWVDHDDTCALVNTTLERRKGRDLLADRRVSLLVVDPDDTSRYMQVRGTAELVRHGAIEQLDALTRRYTAHPCFYGHVYPAGQEALETRVIVRIHARRVTLDAIHR